MMSALFDAKTTLTRAVVGEIIVGRHGMHDRQTDGFSTLYFYFLAAWSDYSNGTTVYKSHAFSSATQKINNQ